MLSEAERRAKRSSPRSRSIPTPIPVLEALRGFREIRRRRYGHTSRQYAMPRDRKYYCAYIMGSLSGTLYIGVSGNLHRRVFQHKFHHYEGFTHRYEVVRLLYWESYDDVHKALAREKQLKGWTRAKKTALSLRALADLDHWMREPETV